MKSIISLTILLYILGTDVWAQNTIFCSHPELCRMINRISNEKTESLVTIVGDPHEYEPSTMEIKKLISAPILITGPNELNPWIKKINFQRSKISNLKTIPLLFDQNIYQMYPGANGEALSHFWLYPKVYCNLKSKLEIELQKLSFIINKATSCDSFNAEAQLRAVLIKINKPIILTHDALLPLFLSLAKSHKFPIVAIKGSGHHEEANPESIKKMYGAMEAPQVIWILEAGINIPQNILNKIRKNDIVLKIDTGKSKDGEEFSVLGELTKSLTPYAEKSQ